MTARPVRRPAPTPPGNGRPGRSTCRAGRAGTTRASVVGERGAAAIEVAVVFPAVLALIFVVFQSVYLTADAVIDTRRAAEEAARAASLEQTPGGATAAADAVLAGNVGGENCTAELDVSAMEPGEPITATVTCERSFPLGISRSFTRQAIEIIDVRRDSQQ